MPGRVAVRLGRAHHPGERPDPSFLAETVAPTVARLTEPHGSSVISGGLKQKETVVVHRLRVVSTTVAILAAAVVLGVRLLEDYLVVPRVLGDAVGLTPLVVLVSVTSVGILFGGFAVILAIPIAACVSTLIAVIIRNRDPAEEDVPTVLFSASDSET